MADPHKPRLWLVCDQLPYPPRNGVTLPAFHHAMALRERAELRLLLLAEQAPDAAALAANEALFGPIEVRTLHRRPAWRRLVDELRGREMFQHGFTAAPRRLDCAPGDALLVTPISAAAKLRALDADAPRRCAQSVALVSDCTAGEYRYRLQERAGGWRHRLKGGLDRWRSAGIGRIESRLLSPYGRVALQTPRDAEIFAALAPGAPRCGLLPNGVHEALFDLPAPSPEARRIVFMAELSGEYGPIAEWLLREVWPAARRPGFTLAVVGRGASPGLRALLAATPQVTHQEYVPELRAVYQDAAIALAPVFKGFGLINKTLEAMAAGLPVLGGRAAFNGLAGFVPGQQGLACERADAPSFIQALQRLQDEAGLRQRIGQDGRALVRGAFRWQDSSARLAEWLGLESAR